MGVHPSSASFRTIDDLATSLALFTHHRCTLPSPPTLAKYLPSGENINRLTPDECPIKVAWRVKSGDDEGEAWEVLAVGVWAELVLGGSCAAEVSTSMTGCH